MPKPQWPLWRRRQELHQPLVRCWAAINLAHHRGNHPLVPLPGPPSPSAPAPPSSVADAPALEDRWMKTATTLLLVPSSFAAAYTAVARRPARSRYHCTWSTAISGTEDRTLALKQPGVAVRAAAGRKRKQIYRQPTAPDVEGDVSRDRWPQPGADAHFGPVLRCSVCCRNSGTVQKYHELPEP